MSTSAVPRSLLLWEARNAVKTREMLTPIPVGALAAAAHGLEATNVDASLSSNRGMDITRLQTRLGSTPPFVEVVDGHLPIGVRGASLRMAP